MDSLRRSWWLVILFLGLSVSFASAAGKMDMGPNSQTTKVTEGQIICPVLTGEKASSEYSYQYKGETYYFCCAECIETFKKNPEKYISRIKEFTVSAKKFEFNPAEIKVKQNDIVRITLAPKDTTHGFMIKEYGINISAKKGETKQVEFLADKTGTFVFRCSHFCGLGHFKMQGKLIVE